MNCRRSGAVVANCWGSPDLRENYHSVRPIAFLAQRGMALVRLHRPGRPPLVPDDSVWKSVADLLTGLACLHRHAILDPWLRHFLGDHGLVFRPAVLCPGTSEFWNFRP